MKKVATYSRVSTQKQEKEETIQSQVVSLREMTSSDILIDEYIDDGWSGTSLARPELDRLRDDAKAGKFEILYVYDPDRLSRNHIHLGIIQEEIEKCGIQIIFKNTSYNNNPEGKLLFGMQGLIAEYEREKILERTRRGRLQKAKRGFIIGSIAPYGYVYIKKNDKENGYYKINTEEKHNVLIIFDLFLKIKSVRGVVTELHKKGIKPQNGKEYWAKSTVARILRNTTYIGTTYYNKNYSYETDNGKRYKRNIKTGKKLRKKEEWIPISAPEMVGKEDFYRVQEILDFNKLNLRPAKNKYLLTGLVDCGVCGSRFVGDPSDGCSCYRCTSRHKPNTVKEKCTNKQIRTDKIDGVVWEEISKALLNPEIITKQIKKMSEQLKGKKDVIREQLNEIEEIKQKKEEGKRRLIKVYSDGSITEKDFSSAIDEMNSEINNLSKEESNLKINIDTINREPEVVKDIKYFCKKIYKSLENADFNKRKEIISLVCEKIVYQQDKVVINALIPQYAGFTSTTSEYCVHRSRQFPRHVLQTPDL